MQSELLRLQKIKRRTIVFISHDLDEAMRIGDRVAIMKDGHVVQVGTPEEILRQPANDYVATSCAAWMRRPCSRPAILPARARSWCRSRRRTARGAVDAGRAGPRYAYVVDPQRKFLGMVSADSLAQCAGRPSRAAGPGARLPAGSAAIAADEPVAGLFGQVAQLPYAVPVVAMTAASTAPSARPPC
jgi:glycine betaine/proline transport system ATP-binding protein